MAVAAIASLSVCVALISAAGAATPYVDCIAEKRTPGECFTRHGRYSWHPVQPADCTQIKSALEETAKRKTQLNWQNLFMNERCHRLGLDHYEGMGKSDPK